MATKKSLASKYGMQSMGLDDNFMSQHMGGGGNSSTQQTYQPFQPTDYLKASNAVVPGGVPGYLQANTAANPNGSKVGVDASKQATKNLTQTSTQTSTPGNQAPVQPQLPEPKLDMSDILNSGVEAEAGNSAANFELRLPDAKLDYSKKLDTVEATPLSKLSVGDKLANSKVGQMGGKVMEATSKHAGKIAMVSTAMGLYGRVKSGQKAVKSLKGSISNLEGVMNSASNTEAAVEKGMLDEFTENRRRIGARQNLALGETLNRVRGSNLNTGSIQKMKEDITDRYNTSADLSLAGAEDSYSKQVNQYTLDSRAERASNKSSLDQLRAQLEESEKAASPLNAIGDLVVAGVTIANPAAGMALGMAKSQIA